MFSSLSWLREMEKAEWNPLDASRARQNGAGGHKIQALCQETSFRVQESLEDTQPLHLAPAWETFIPMFPGGAEELSAGKFGQTGFVLQGEELVWMPGGELGLWVCDPPEDQLD